MDPISRQNNQTDNVHWGLLCAIWFWIIEEFCLFHLVFPTGCGENWKYRLHIRIDWRFPAKIKQKFPQIFCNIQGRMFQVKACFTWMPVRPKRPRFIYERWDGESVTTTVRRKSCAVSFFYQRRGLTLLGLLESRKRMNFSERKKSGFRFAKMPPFPKSSPRMFSGGRLVEEFCTVLMAILLHLFMSQDNKVSYSTSGLTWVI